ncbi:hypothetical protein [Gimesia sp.]|uniref:hypothetical protein n=1 Tax=Gimesia sp. TaxID=2024833 RepID=UPI000C61ABB2|nr:hypothetical protein [Gimesia sp.]MAX40474.1 hypothetical protein [Gimesia sp.]HAH45170.1 hypothetical protein [Planctomycetaceae bacterium]HBL48576.1 hypothetical protein [Planctomycetaceae bacterium]|tara:strand:+ start:690 stop:1124 length:435 start_codon:yes stop_codon:yes gene_type:complete
MTCIPIYDAGRNSLTNLIGWLSLCLIAAGWGAEFDMTIRHLWANIGLFGLVSMIGLKMVQMSKLKAQQMATESRVEHDVKRISKGKDSAILLKAELERLEKEDRSATFHSDRNEIEKITHSTDAELVSMLRYCLLQSQKGRLRL